jgi:hypothetical protein
MHEYNRTLEVLKEDKVREDEEYKDDNKVYEVTALQNQNSQQQ